jgi:hypothetical protein
MESDRFFRNVANFLPDYTVSHPRSQESSYSLRSDIVKTYLFISRLFNDGVNSSGYIAPNERMIVNTELERMRKEAVVAEFGVLSGGAEHSVTIGCLLAEVRKLSHPNAKQGSCLFDRDVRLSNTRNMCRPVQPQVSGYGSRRPCEAGQKPSFSTDGS